ncbi:MAG: response regulator transcription factor [Bacteroidetes bacterium]|nr:response regulator transcription factor [Bacteroidota bacterium]
MEKVKLLLVDDHAVVRKGLIALLEDEESIHIAGDVGSGREAIEVVPDLKPDLVMLDLNMPEMNGVETAGILSQKFPELKKLVFSMHNDPHYVMNSIEKGVDGYLLKDCEKEEIMEAIATISNGGKYFPNQISSVLINAIQSKNQSPEKSKTKGLLNLLSKKEKEILKLISEGKSSPEISKILELSVRTVSNHRANMLKKTAMNNTAELIRMVSMEGF